MASYPDEKGIAPTSTIPLDSYPKSKSTTGTESPVQTPSVDASELPRQKWYQYFAPTDTPEERRLILELDGLIMVFVFWRPGRKFWILRRRVRHMSVV